MHIGLLGSDRSFALRYILYIFMLNWSHIVRFLFSGVKHHCNVSRPADTIFSVYTNIQYCVCNSHLRILKKLIIRL
jgi:hypothetical protein